MILWVKSVPQHHLSSHRGHYNRTEVARSEVGGEVLLFAERWAGNPDFHPTPLQEPRDGTAGGEQHPSHGTRSPWDALRWKGGCSLQEAAAKDPCGGGAVPGKGGGTSQHLSWVLRADLTVCTITHPTHIQRAASWGWRQMHTCPQILGEIICDYLTSQNFPNNVANWEGKRER